MYNAYVKRIFVITEIMHMNASVSSESRERKRLKSHSHEGWHPRSTSTSGAESGASQVVPFLGDFYISCRTETYSPIC